DKEMRVRRLRRYCPIFAKQVVFRGAGFACVGSAISACPARVRVRERTLLTFPRKRRTMVRGGIFHAPPSVAASGLANSPGTIVRATPVRLGRIRLCANSGQGNSPL